MKQSCKFWKLPAVGLLLAGGAFAQAPAGPITPPPSSIPAAPPTRTVQIPPRKNILGAWRLNRDESDDPKTRSNQRKVNDSSGSRGGNSGPRIGFPGGGIGGPGVGGPRNTGSSQKDTDADRERYLELIDPSVRLRMERKSDK